MDRAAKEAFVTDFAEKLSRTRLAILADYRGLDANTIVQFRKGLAASEGGVEFRVIKNSLVSRAIEGTSFELVREHLSGPNAVILGYGDIVEAAKLTTDFVKDNEEIELKFGVLDGKELSVEQLTALADLPAKEVLQAMLLGVLQAPSRNLVSLLANCNRQLVNVLSAYKDKLEGEGS
jgi:large subunit ribosomal protein L10